MRIGPFLLSALKWFIGIAVIAGLAKFVFDRVPTHYSSWSKNANRAASALDQNQRDTVYDSVKIRIEQAISYQEYESKKSLDHFRRRSLSEVKQRRNKLAKEINGFKVDIPSDRLKMLFFGGEDKLFESIEVEAVMSVKAREIDALDELISQLERLNKPKVEWESRRSVTATHIDDLRKDRAELLRTVRRFEALRSQCATPDCSRFLGSRGDHYQRLKDELDRRTDDLRADTRQLRAHTEATKRAQDAYYRARAAVAGVALSASSDFDIQGALDDVENEAENGFTEFIHDFVYVGLPTAFNAAAVGMVIWFGVRALLFFILAPWMVRRPSFQLAPSLRPLELPSTFSPGREIEVRLSDDEELVIRPDHVELEPGDTVVGHVSVLSRRSWFRSLTRGLHSFERITAKDGSVAVQSKSHQSSVVEIILEGGSALALNPDNLVGLVRAKNAPALHLEFPFRPFRAFAWVTGQFRYFYVCGPARVILKGGGELKLEPPAGRLMPWPAVVAFDASTNLRARRPKSFWSYLWSLRSLAQVTTEGAEGFVIRQQMSWSDDLRRPGPERAFGGTVDAAMKPFGG